MFHGCLRNLHKQQCHPSYFEMGRTELTYDNHIQPTVYDTWLSNVTSKYVCHYVLNADETAAYNAVASAVATIRAENVTKFITGDNDLSQWDSFIQSLRNLGIDRLTEIVQSAVDPSV